MNTKFVVAVFGILVVVAFFWTSGKTTQTPSTPHELEIGVSATANEVDKPTTEDAASTELPANGFESEYAEVFNRFDKAIPVVQEIVTGSQCVAAPLAGRRNENLVCLESAKAFHDVAEVIGLCADRAYRFAGERAQQRRESVERLSEKLSQKVYYQTLAQIDEVEQRQSYLATACKSYEQAVLPPLHPVLAGGNLLRLTYVNHAVLSGAEDAAMEYVDAATSINSFLNGDNEEEYQQTLELITENVAHLVETAPGIGYAQRALLEVSNVHLSPVAHQVPEVATKLEAAIASLMLSYAQDKELKLTSSYGPLANMIVSAQGSTLVNNALYIAEAEHSGALDLAGFNNHLVATNELSVHQAHRDK